MKQELSVIYDTIADSIISPQGLCVLILGPELAVNKDGKGYKSHFRDAIPASSSSQYFDGENLFYFQDETDKQVIRKKVLDFYKNVGDDALLEMISRLVFPLVINASPDKAINNTYTQKNITFQEGYFTKNSKSDYNDLPQPKKDNPIIYNILGCVDDPLSLILTHSKLYETLEYLLPEKSLPDNIEAFLKKVNCFIFLGFKFDSWYYQLICHKLGIKGTLDAKINLSTLFDSNNTINVIMNSSFDMEFTMENPYQCMLNIIKACEEKLKSNPVALAKSVRAKNPNANYSTFVSYARSDDGNQHRENIVDLIEKDMIPGADSLFQLFRDRKDISYGDSIDSYMTRIGMGKTVIRVISEKYLTSIYCMVEALRISEYKDVDKRVFTIVMEDATLDPAGSTRYKEYWLNQCQTILGDANKLEHGRFDQYVRVYRFIDAFIDEINNELHLKLRYDEITKDGSTVKLSDARKAEYDEFLDRVVKKMKLE